MTNKQIHREFKTIPIQVTEEQFNLFVLPHLSKGKRGPHSKLSFFKTFNYILKLIHTGVQWYCLPIENLIWQVFCVFLRQAEKASLQYTHNHDQYDKYDQLLFDR